MYVLKNLNKIEFKKRLSIEILKSINIDNFYNKPWGLKHWLDHARPAVSQDTVVALIDPDMIFIRPLTTKIRGMENNLHDKKLDPAALQEVIQRGKPVAQLYGLGAPWTNDNHKKFNRTHVCGVGSPCLIPDDKFGNNHYAVGPPYIAVRADFQTIAEAWTQFVPRVYEKYPFLLAEMYAYSMAAAHVNLPHLQMEQYMVSSTDAGGEGWPWIEGLPDVCVPPVDGIYFPGQPMPVLMHYCQHYSTGGVGYHKGNVPKDIFSCESPMLLELAPDFGKIDFNKFSFQTEREKFKEARKEKRSAFSICIAHRSINAALQDYKSKMCGIALQNVTNFDKTLTVARRPAHP